MDKRQLKVGMWIKVTDKDGFAEARSTYGKIGKVTYLAVPDEDYDMVVEFPEPFSGGWECRGHARSKHGRFGFAHEVEPFVTEWDN